MRRGHLDIQERSVHELAKRDLLDFAREAGNETSIPQMLAHRKILDTARRQKTFLHQLVEITEDLHARSQFIVASVKAGYVDAVAAELTRAHAIERRWRMQADKRIGVIPMTARRVMPVADNDVCIGLGQQLVCEAHAGGTAADDQIVGRQHSCPPGTYLPGTVLAAI